MDTKLLQQTRSSAGEVHADPPPRLLERRLSSRTLDELMGAVAAAPSSGATSISGTTSEATWRHSKRQPSPQPSPSGPPSAKHHRRQAQRESPEERAVSSPSPIRADGGNRAEVRSSAHLNPLEAFRSKEFDGDAPISDSESTPSVYKGKKAGTRIPKDRRFIVKE